MVSFRAFVVSPQAPRCVAWKICFQRVESRHQLAVVPRATTPARRCMRRRAADCPDRAVVKRLAPRLSRPHIGSVAQRLGRCLELSDCGIGSANSRAFRKPAAGVSGGRPVISGPPLISPRGSNWAADPIARFDVRSGARRGGRRGLFGHGRFLFSRSVYRLSISGADSVL